MLRTWKAVKAQSKMLVLGFVRTDLVSIAPEKVLCAKVLVWVFCSFLQWCHVVPMSPMGIPERLRIYGGDEKARNGGTVGKVSILMPSLCRFAIVHSNV